MTDLEKILKARDDLKEKSPLVHAITQPIAINMVANAILFMGAKAICAAHPDEVAEIVEMSDSLSVNLGNITSERMVSIDRASDASNKKKIPLAIDLVGVGASSLRYDFANDLLNKYHFDLIKGNSSEIRALAKAKSNAKGIDVGKEDEIGGDNIEKIALEARKLSQKYKSVILVTGKTDLIVTENSYFTVDNGVENLSKITGTGCMLTAMISTLMAVTDTLSAAICGLLVMEVAAEKADTDRLYTFFVNLMDEIATIKNSEIIEKAKVREIKFWKNYILWQILISIARKNS